MGPLGMSVLLGAAFAACGSSAWRRWRLMLVARAPLSRGDRLGERIAAVMTYVFGQKRMFRYSLAGVAHAAIFFGFVVLLINSLILWGRGFDRHFDLWIFGLDNPLGVAYALLRDVFVVLVIAGVLVFAYYRLVARPRRMTLSAEGMVILGIILAMMVGELLYSGGEIRRMATGGESAGPAFHAAMPFSSLVGMLLTALPDGAAGFLWQLGFWMHAVLVLLFLNLLPYGKHFHVLTVIPNVFARNLDGIGRLTTVQDIEGRLERGETLGVARAADLSWKAVLDMYTCTECGRCSDHCPATNTGKLLSPKHLLVNLRDHVYANEAALLARASGNGDASATFVAPDGQPVAEGADGADGTLAPVWVDPEMLWACTTCGACEQECPVFISYVDKIVDMRRNLVMERGEFPDQLQNAFRGLESVGNPYSFANEQRADWAAGLDIPLRSEKPDAEVLYWVGCAPSFDDRSRKIARATARLMKLAGVDFAILGPREKCTGDPARRAGNEYLYQSLVQENVATLNELGVRRIVTTCPHCFNALKNEYPDFGGRYEVVHHTTFLAELLRAGRLRPIARRSATVVYHDSCYLGRYNDEYDAPRELLRAVPGLTLVEAPQSRDRGMGCGAGGAQMWKEDEAIRRPGSREGDGKVNHARTRQLLRVLPAAPAAGAASAGSGASGAAGAAPGAVGATGASSAAGAAPGTGSGGERVVASACPFCMTMLRDGLRDQGHEDVQPQDVAEILLQAVEAEG